MHTTTRTHKSGSKRRHKFKVYNWNFLFYSKWGAESIRQVKKHHDFRLFEWDRWVRDGEARPFDVWTQSEVDYVDALEGPYQPTVTGIGYRSWVFEEFGVLPSTFDKIVMKYEWAGRNYELSAGTNWVTLSFSVTAVILALFAIGFFVVASTVSG